MDKIIIGKSIHQKNWVNNKEHLLGYKLMNTQQQKGVVISKNRPTSINPFSIIDYVFKTDDGIEHDFIDGDEYTVLAKPEWMTSERSIFDIISKLGEN
jgi:hypothetical protein